MAPPSKRRKLLQPAQDVAQQFETATKSSIPPFSHGVEHIPATKPAQALYARPSPHHIEELHLEIQTRSVPSAEEQIRLLRRQGTAALTDIITTNSEADVVVAVTAMVDALGSTTALTTAAVTVDVPDLPSLLATSTTTAVVLEDSAEPTASSSQETSAEPTPSSSQESPADPISSTAQESSPEPTTSSESSQSESATSSDDSRSSDTPSSTNAPASSSSTSDTSLPTYAISPASENGTDNDPQSTSQSESSTESETSSSVAPSSTSGTSGSAPASYGPASYGAPSGYSASSSQDTATLESSTSSNSTVPISTSASSQSQTSQTVFTPTGSGFSVQTGSASSRNSLNLTTSASTSTSGSVILVSDFTITYASSTSETASQSTDSSSSIDLNLLYLLTQSDGEVSTLIRSDEPFTTSISGSEIVVPASSSAASDSRVPASSVSAYVTTISNDETTVLSTALSTASPSSTHSSSDEADGVGLAGVAGDGATATSNGVSSTSAPADTNNDDDEPAPAGTIAGGVVGGAAGLALVALIILLFLRRYKKRTQLGHLALPANAAGPAAGGSTGSGSVSRGMAERAGLMPLVGAVPALFRHQNRSQNSGSETGERGFQRVAGRKLPSAFSEGMTGPPQPTMSPPPSMPLVGDDDGHERNLSSHSFYRDSAGFYGGDGSTATSPNPFSDSNLPATAAGSTAAHQMVMSPGPQRRPTIHAPKSEIQEPSVATSGTPSWTPSYTAGFARSETPASLDSGRNSRFTEEV